MLRRQCLRYLQGGGYGEAVNTADCGSVTRGFDPHYSPHNLHIVITVGVSPSGKATDFDSVMRRSDSVYPCQKSKSTCKEHVLFLYIFEVVKDSVKGPASSRAIWSDTVQNGRPPEISKWSPLHTNTLPVPDHIYWYLPPLAVPVRHHLSSFLFL